MLSNFVKKMKHNNKKYMTNKILYGRILLLERVV